MTSIFIIQAINKTGLRRVRIKRTKMMGARMVN